MMLRDGHFIAVKLDVASSSIGSEVVQKHLRLAAPAIRGKDKFSNACGIYDWQAYHCRHFVANLTPPAPTL